MAGSYPDTPAGRSRRLRDADDELMTRNGHRMKWKRWRKGPWRRGGNTLGFPAWEGTCVRCFDVIRVAALARSAYTSITGADGKSHGYRQCRGRSR